MTDLISLRRIPSRPGAELVFALMKAVRREVGVNSPSGGQYRCSPDLVSLCTLSFESIMACPSSYGFSFRCLGTSTLKVSSVPGALDCDRRTLAPVEMPPWWCPRTAARSWRDLGSSPG
ncbi:unnamed protein product, partial [Choristocarpus tenellus]